MTLEELLKDAKLREEARNHFREELEVELSVSQLQEENESLKEELAEFRLKEELAEKTAEVANMIKESKLPDELKDDEEIFETLMDAKPERRKVLLERFERVASDAGKTQNGNEAKPSAARSKEVDISEGRNGNINVHAALHKSLTRR